MHSRQVAPVWESLAKRFEVDPGVVIATIDGTHNDVADVHVMAYPTFLLFPAGSEAKVCEKYKR